MPERRLAAIVAGALTAALILAACTGEGLPTPTPDTPSPTSSPTGSPDLRCLHDAAFLILQAAGVQAVLTTLNATDRTSSDLQTAIAAAQAFQDRVRVTTVHHPFLADRLTLIAGSSARAGAVKTGASAAGAPAWTPGTAAAANNAPAP